MIDPKIIQLNCVACFFVLTSVFMGCGRENTVSPAQVSESEPQETSLPTNETNSQARSLSESLNRLVERGEKDKVIQLLAAGADPNYGAPLYSAARWGYKDIAEILLNKGADVNSSFAGITAFDIATKMGYGEIADLLEQHGGKTGTELGISKGTPSPINTFKSTRIRTKVTFTTVSNGYDWQRADLASRQQFCETIAAAMTKKFKRSFTTDFYFSALESFYDSSDPNILNQNIHQIIGLTTSAAMQ